MPQLILEMSSNVLEKNVIQTQDLLREVHVILTQMLPTQLASCKSRVIIHDVYRLGDGDERNAFVHVNLKIMSGRSKEILSGVGETLLRLMESHFVMSREKRNCQFSIEIMELAETYFKT